MDGGFPGKSGPFHGKAGGFLGMTSPYHGKNGGFHAKTGPFQGKTGGVWDEAGGFPIEESPNILADGGKPLGDGDGLDCPWRRTCRRRGLPVGRRRLQRCGGQGPHGGGRTPEYAW
jgi:hypothetical protein